MIAAKEHKTYQQSWQAVLDLFRDEDLKRLFGYNYNQSTEHIFAGNTMVATITVTPHIISGSNPSCTPPSSGDWTITNSCTFTGTALAPQSVIVNAGKVLTLDAGSKLLIDFKHYKLLVKKTGGVLVKKTASLRQVKASDTGTNTYYHHTDHLTGSNVVTDSDAAVVELLDYYPYGSQRLKEQSGSFDEQKKFTGYERDDSTGLDYAGARYYNSSNGKFISQDPQFISVGFDLTNPQSFNSYSYAGNNPIVNVDPMGNVYFSAKSLGQNVGGFGVGMLQGGWSFVKGTANIILNPYDSFVAGRQSLDNVSSLISNGIQDPKGTAQAVSQGFSSAYDNFDSKSAYEQGKTVGNFTGQIEAGILAGAAVNKGLQMVENEVSFTRAGEHVFNEHPNRFPGKSASEIADIARGTKASADVKVNIAGPNAKQYYFNSQNGNLFINNPKQPTVFNTTPNYLNNTILDDIKRGGVVK